MQRQFALILILTAIINMGMGIIIPILPTLLKQFGISTAGMSLPFFSLILGRFISKYYANKVSKFFSDRNILKACFVLYSFVFLIYPFISSIELFSVVRFLEGVVEGIGIISLTDRAIALSSQNRGKLMGYFSSAFGVGFITGPLLGNITYTYFGNHGMFMSGMLIGLVGFVSCFALSHYENNAVLTNKAKHFSERFISYMRYFNVYGPSLLRRVLFFAFMIILPLYLTEHFNLKNNQVAYYFSLSAILTTTLMPFTGKLADKLSASSLTFFGLIMMAMLIIGFGLVHNLVFFTVLYIIETIMFAIMLPAGMKVFAECIEKHPSRKDIIGFFGSMTEVITLFQAVLLPIIYSYSPAITWGILGICCFLAALPFMWKHESYSEALEVKM